VTLLRPLGEKEEKENFISPSIISQISVIDESDLKKDRGEELVFWCLRIKVELVCAEK
jgi:hypothetical protein